LNDAASQAAYEGSIPFARSNICGSPSQQPDGGADTPGVAAAPVALAGAMVPGVDRYIVTLSAHAEVFGVGITGMVGSMLVPPSPVTSGGIVPGAGLAGICGVESGSAAPLVGGPPGVELHTTVDALPSGDVGDMVPVVLPNMEVGIVPNGAVVDDISVLDGVIVAVLPAIDVETVDCTVEATCTGGAAMEGEGRAGTAGGGGAGTVVPGSVDKNEVAGCADSVSKGALVLPVADVEEVAEFAADVVGAADIDDVIPVAPPTVDIDAIGTGGSPGAICPVGVAQVTTVPGVVGSEASGTGASVVSGTPDWVAAENGLGPLSGDVTIAPGVDARPMAVLPMVETCAGAALQPASRMAVVSSRRRIAIFPLRRSSWSAWPAPCAPRPCCLPRD
jgi:hypothetical protein